MQRVKWVSAALMLLLAVALCAACAGNRGTRVIEGYIVDYDGEMITIDPVEFLTSGQSARVDELGLNTERDFRDGYYIHNEGSRDRVTYPVAQQAQIRFADNMGTGVANGAAGADYDVAINGAIENRTPNNVVPGNTVNHMGRALGGTAGGITGGVEMLSSRFGNGVRTNDNTPYFFTIVNGYVTGIEEVRAYSNFAGGQNLSTGAPAIGR